MPTNIVYWLLFIIGLTKIIHQRKNREIDSLHILTKPTDDENAHDFGGAINTHLDYERLGLTRHNAILLGALI